MVVFLADWSKMQPQIVLLKDGTESSQGKQQVCCPPLLPLRHGNHNQALARLGDLQHQRMQRHCRRCENDSGPPRHGQVNLTRG